MNTRASLLIAAILCVIGSALCQTPPKLPQQFTTNFTLDIPDYPSSVNVRGFLAFDYIHYGAFLDIGGEQYIPVSFHTNFVASPDNQGGITTYMYEGPLCWNMGAMGTWMISPYLFQIPQNSTYLGNNVINGQSCTGWYFEVNYSTTMYVTMWISTSNSNNIVQMRVANLLYFGLSFNSVVINFSNTVVGPFSPYIYAPPMKTNPSITSCIPWPNNK